MKSLFMLLVIGAIGWFAWQKFAGGGPPPVFENPVYAEVRGTASVGSREMEMVVFGRAASDADCQARARISVEGALSACPGCRMQPVSCKHELPPRYARLFDDVPIPSAYLSMSAGASDERDARLVIHGLTDQEGAYFCEEMRKMVLQKYRGTAHCVAASGG